MIKIILIEHCYQKVCLTDGKAFKRILTCESQPGCQEDFYEFYHYILKATLYNKRVLNFTAVNDLSSAVDYSMRVPAKNIHFDKAIMFPLMCSYLCQIQSACTSFSISELLKCRLYQMKTYKIREESKCESFEVKFSLKLYIVALFLNGCLNKMFYKIKFLLYIIHFFHINQLVYLWKSNTKNFNGTNVSEVLSKTT